MSKVALYDMTGASQGEVDIPDALLELEKGDQAVHDVVVATMAQRRAGTASTLSKGEVAGSGAKPWRQKGTGRARAGYKQSPVWRGGAVAFGPHPRSYAKKVNRKVAKLALRRAFGDKVASGSVKMVKAVDLSEPRTKAFIDVLKAMKIDGSVLFVFDKLERNVILASRNIPKVVVTRAADVCVYDLLRYATVVVSEAGMDALSKRLKTDGGDSK